MAEGEAGAGHGQPDAVLLSPLTEDTFLHNLHVRYKRDLIYTYVGNALVSVNPCRALPLYSAELVRAYLARAPHLLPPHLYAITAAAVRWVRDRRESQCIVITGESGAGKTEAARVCLQCAVVGGGAGGAGGGAGAALTAAGTLLEAFGNAATARNHNASRFGKLLDVEFDFRGLPVGGHITHYLLEKERVCGAAEGERNFHVFYQLLAGADAHLLKRLRLQRSWEQYLVLRGSGAAEGGSCAGACAGGGEAGASPRRATPTPPAAAHPPPPPPGPRPDAADKDHFAYTKAAMAALGFGGGECGAVLRLLAFVLKLGNVQFEPAHNIDGSIGVRLRQRYELSEACALVGVDEEALAAALGAAPPALDANAESSELESCSGEGSADGDGAWECGAEWAAATRDRLLAALYSRLFTWLIVRVNDAIKVYILSPVFADLGSLNKQRVQAAINSMSESTIFTKSWEDVSDSATDPEPLEPGARCTLGILDVYGFESLARNGLERLLINYAAERVQGAAAVCALRREQDEYAREGLAWTPPAYQEHEPVADLLDLGPDSVLGALRECSARALPDAAFLQRLARRRHPRLRVAPPDRFQVVHFAGPVTYSARGIVEHNRDAVCRRCSAALAAAREPLLAALFAPAPMPGGGGGGGGGSPRRPLALACRQRALVGALARRLAAGGAPRLVRCLRPDAALRPHRLDLHLLRRQIQDQGIMDMAHLRRNGWCESMCARALLARYGILAGAGAGAGASSPGGGGGGGGDPVRAARALLRSLPIPSAEFAYGRTKVFIRSPRTVWELEALRGARVAALVVGVQRAWRRYLRRRRDRAAGVIARAWRRHKATRDLPERQALQRRLEARRRALGAGGRAWAAGVVWRAWCAWARRRYVAGLWARLPARHRSPACGAWPACAQPRLLGRADALLRRLHHRWRCRLYRANVDQVARNRMREKVTASVLFKDRKASYSCSVAHPFVGDYVRLRASLAWRRGCGAGSARAPDAYVVFADVAGRVGRGGGARPALCVLSTGALLLLEPRSLRAKRRVPAHHVYRLSLSPYADDLLAVHVRACGGAESSAEEASQCSGRGLEGGCLRAGGGGGRGGARGGDLLLRTCHVLELATKLFLVVQNAVGAPPHVNIAPQFEVTVGQQTLTVSFHCGGEPASAPTAPRLLRRGSRLDVLV